MLEGLGYEVATETDSLAALERFKTDPEQFDLIITDMTGDKLAGEITKIRPEIPMILCTGFNSSISEEKAKELGFKAFVMKPLSEWNLAEIFSAKCFSKCRFLEVLTKVSPMGYSQFMLRVRSCCVYLIDLIII